MTYSTTSMPPSHSERGVDGVVVSTSTWVQYLVTEGMAYLLLKPGSQHWGLCIPHESENHVNVGTISIWDIKSNRR